jgi:hypothetical protein
VNGTGIAGSEFPNHIRYLWKTWKARPMWETRSLDRQYPCGWGYGSHKTHVGFTGLWGPVVEDVGNAGWVRAIGRVFSNCPEMHSRVLEKYSAH